MTRLGTTVGPAAGGVVAQATGNATAFWLEGVLFLTAALLVHLFMAQVGVWSHTAAASSQAAAHTSPFPLSLRAAHGGGVCLLRQTQRKQRQARTSLLGLPRAGATQHARSHRPGVCACGKGVVTSIEGRAARCRGGGGGGDDCRKLCCGYRSCAFGGVCDGSLW